MRWAGNAARMGRCGSVYKIWREILKEMAHLEDLDVSGRII
jgi:hypothetical protein